MSNPLKKIKDKLIKPAEPPAPSAQDLVDAEAGNQDEAAEATPEMPDGESEVVDTPVSSKEPQTPPVASEQASEQPPQPKLTKEEQELVDEIKAYRKEYGEFYTSTDMANIPDTTLKAEEMNMLLAQVIELRRLNKLIKGLK